VRRGKRNAEARREDPEGAEVLREEGKKGKRGKSKGPRAALAL
jgi:hypothetical protein